jgi:hypothetical protein
MAYGLFRVRELQLSELSSTDVHNARRYEAYSIATPENILSQKQGEYGINHFYNHTKSDFENDIDPKDFQKLEDIVKERISFHELKVKKGQNVAIEVVVGINGHDWEDAHSKYSSSALLQHCAEVAHNILGGELIAQYAHFDESTPHMHLIIMPIKTKKIKWKNSTGQGEKIEKRLCAKDFTGKKAQLSDYQTKFSESLKRKFEPYGIQIQRGTKAEESKKKYEKHTTAFLGYLRNDIKKINTDILKLKESVLNGLKSVENAKIEYKELSSKIESKEKELNSLNSESKEKLSEFKRLEAIRQNRNQDEKWKKGKDFDKGF